MVTFTSSGLAKPDYADPASVFPINDNSELIDRHGMGAYVVEDDTFPADPWEGMKVYKGPEQELYVWSTMNGGVPAGEWWLIGAGRKIAYTPVVSGITLGSGGSIQGEYFRVGHNGLPNAVSIHYRMRLQLGTGGDVTATMAVGLPGVPESWAAAGTDLIRVVGHALGALSASPGTATPAGVLVTNTDTVVGSGGETQQMCNIARDTTQSGGLWNASLPHDWAANSNVWIQGHYWPDQNGTSWGV